jgi:hypothetical protein
MLTDEIVAAVARFFADGKGPSHDELSRQFSRAGLTQFDPAKRTTEPVGKMKRVREVLSRALDVDPAAGAKVVKALVGCIKAAGGFRPTSPDYAGDELVEAARDAFRAVGYELDPEGNLRPLVLDNLNSAEATVALWAYVRRARVGANDAALVVGTGKDLLEATARHVLVQATGGYGASDNFPTTLYQAFDRLGLATSVDMLKLLDKDPRRAMEQSLYLLGNAVNRLRNAEGTGHGRPFAAEISDGEARIAIQAMGLISQMLLDRSRGAGG